MFKKTFKQILISTILFFIFLLSSFKVFAGIGFTEAEDPIVGKPPQKVEDRFILEPDEYEIEVWIENLRIPWELVFLTENKALVTERAGQIRLIENGTLQEKPYRIVDEVVHIGEGGLMGLTKHPDYPKEKYLYLMHTYQENNKIFNRVVRYLDTDTTIVFDQVIIDKIPGSRVHNGGRIAFGLDRMLYICTGDTWESEIAQDVNNLGGKILRYTSNGEIPADNPFTHSPVYSLGHRNPQGLAWHPETGDLFSSEHGPSGEFGLYNRDIINVIQKGGNYGWPLVLGDANVEPYIDPMIMWTRSTPPSGMTFWNERLFLASLRSEALIRIDVKKLGTTYEINAIDRLFAEDWSSGTYGRLRNVVVGPDNALYVLTNNHDGRGMPRDGDDKILKITFK
ncbi:MAG: PQQ-dependent sugar dehydrogenase [Candidatus Atribacteria bacterium]|nr:PQQ-dependent sugar dehydrogenase [Candidatus Atribacteria bacterium]